MDLNTVTGKNVKWSFIESISLKLVGFVLSIILARLLTPADFGVLAIVNVFYLLVHLFIDGGLKEALIQKKHATDTDYSTMFWLNLAMALILYGVLFLLAPFIESFYKYDGLGFYIRLQSVTLIIESFGFIQIVKATRDLNLKRITTARIPASIISFFVGIGMAYSGFGVISLIIQQLVSILIYTLLLTVKVKYKPQMLLNIKSIKSLFSFGFKIIAISYISRFYVQSLNLLYAFYFTPSLLGLYTKSKSLQGAPIEIISATFSKGIYPTMVKVQQHNRFLRKIFLSNFRRLSFLMIFLNGVLFFNAYNIVLFLLGDQWIEMTVYLKIVAVGSLLLPVTAQIINLFKAKGLPDLVLKIEIAVKSTTLVIILSLAGFSEFTTIIWVIASINILSGIIFLFFCSKLIEFDFINELLNVLALFSYHIFLGLSISYLLENYFTDIQGVIQIVVFTIIYTLGAIAYGFIRKDYQIKRIF